MEINLDTTGQFFDAVFGLHDLRDSDILLWFSHPQADRKESAFVQTKEQYQATLLRYKDWNSYYGICLRPHQAIPNVHWRGKRADTTALVVIGVDIDIVNPSAHKAYALPESEALALELVTEYPDDVRPSLIVKSGFGLQCLWLLEEPEWFSQDISGGTDRAVAEWVITHVWGVAASAGQARRWKVDSTCDLPRVYRIPGTINHKDKDNPRLAACAFPEPITRYPSLGDIDRRLPHVKNIPPLADAIRGDAPPPRGRRDVPAHIKAQCDALILPEETAKTTKIVIDALREADSRFNKTWEKKRTDFPKGDYSPSGYDMSLAMQCLYAGMSAQEVVNILCAYRRKYDCKFTSHYMRWTMESALLFYEQKKTGQGQVNTEGLGAVETKLATEQQQSEVKQAEVDAQEQTKEREEAEKERFRNDPNLKSTAQREILDGIQEFFDFPEDVRITDCKYVLCDAPYYQFGIENGKRPYPPVKLYSHRCEFKDVKLLFTPATQVQLLAKGKTAGVTWGVMYNKLRELFDKEEEEELCSGSDVYYSLCTYLERSGAPEFTEETRETFLRAMHMKQPIRKDGLLYLSPADFRAWTKKDGSIIGGTSQEKVLALLQSLGGKNRVNVSVWVPEEKKSYSRWYWSFSRDPREVPPESVNGHASHSGKGSAS